MSLYYNSTNFCPVSNSVGNSFLTNGYSPVSQVSLGVREKPIGQIVGEMIYKVHTTVSAYLWGVDDKQEMLSMVKTKPHDLYWASKRLKNDKEVVTEAVKRDGTSLQFASPELRNVDKIVILAGKQNIHAWHYARIPTLVKNKKVFINQLLKDAFARCKTHLQKNSFLQEQIEGLTVLLKGSIKHGAQSANDQFINYALSELKSNLERYYPADIVERFGSTIKEMVLRHKEIFDKALLKSAPNAEVVVKNVFAALKKVVEKESDFFFKAHAKVIYEGLAAQGRSIKGSPNNEFVVFYTVMQKGTEIQHASDELRDDKTIALAAVQQNGAALEFLSPRMQDNREVVLAAVSNKGSSLRFANPRFLMDNEIVDRAIYNDSSIVEYALSQ